MIDSHNNGDNDIIVCSHDCIEQSRHKSLSSSPPSSSRLQASFGCETHIEAESKIIEKFIKTLKECSYKKMAAAANCGGVTRPSSGLQISSRQSFLSLQMRRLQRHAQPPRQVDGPNLQVAGVMIDSAPELMSTSRRRRRRRRGSLSDEEVKMAKRNERPRTRGSQVEHNEDLCNESTNTHSNSIKKTRHSINICRPLNESPPLQLPPHLQKSPRRHPLPLPLLTLLLGFCCLGPSIALADHDGDSQGE